MKFDSLLTVNAVLGVVFGLGFVVAPAQTLAMYGFTGDAGHLYLARLLGAAFLLVGILTWQLRGIKDERVIQALSVASVVESAIGAVSSVMATTSGTVNALGWSSVVIYAGLAVAFAKFAFRPRVVAA